MVDRKSANPRTLEVVRSRTLEEQDCCEAESRKPPRFLPRPLKVSVSDVSALVKSGTERNSRGQIR